jgi:cytochrome c biogenesis protein CcmG/thiol:disulfide interchange protein DsbE
MRNWATKPDRRFWNGLLVIAFFMGGVWILASRVPDSQTGVIAGGSAVAPQTGFLAPNFTLTTLDGSSVTLNDLQGTPVLINFWASWCGPCRSEMPHIQTVYKAHRDDGLVVLGVNQLESLPTVAAFVQEFDLTFPIPLDQSGEVSAVYRARALPTSFFVDADGVVRDVFTGPMTKGLLESKLEAILNSATSEGGG